MRYLKTNFGNWVKDTNYRKYNNSLNLRYTVMPEILLRKGGVYGQYLADGTFEERDDIITIQPAQQIAVINGLY